MSEDATIEDEAEAEHPSSSSRPETKTGLLPWSYIFEIATKQWAIFLLISIAIAVFLYMSKQRQHSKKKLGSSIRHDHVQSGSKGASRPAPYKRD